MFVAVVAFGKHATFVLAVARRSALVLAVAVLALEEAHAAFDLVVVHREKNRESSWPYDRSLEFCQPVIFIEIQQVCSLLTSASKAWSVVGVVDVSALGFLSHAHIACVVAAPSVRV